MARNLFYTRKQSVNYFSHIPSLNFQLASLKMFQAKHKRKEKKNNIIEKNLFINGKASSMIL